MLSPSRRMRLRRGRFLAARVALLTVAALLLQGCGLLWWWGGVDFGPFYGAPDEEEELYGLGVSPMGTNQFWQLVDEAGCRPRAVPCGARLAENLTRLPELDVAAFETRRSMLASDIARNRHLYAAEVIMGSVSEDVFSDFRGWVMSQGERVYDDFRRDPETLAENGPSDDEQIGASERFTSAPNEAYEALTGDDLFELLFDVEDDVNATSRSGPGYADLATRYPRLAAVYLPVKLPDGTPFADGVRGIRRR